MSRRGLSLIEILIVLVIIAVVATLSYPAVTSVLADQRLRGATNDVISILQSGRFLAMLRKRAQVVTVGVVDGVPGGSLQLHESTSSACADVAGSPKRTLVLPSATNGGKVGMIDAAPAGLLSSGICFKPDGKVYDGTGLPPAMSDAEQGQYNVHRSSNIGLRVVRFEGADGSLEQVGVRKEVLLNHLGIARINRRLALLVEED